MTKRTVSEILRRNAVLFAAIWLMTAGGGETFGKPTKPESTLAFVASVDYVQPTYDELQFLFSCVDSEYKKEVQFAPIERCKNVSHELRDVHFEYVVMRHDSWGDTDKVLKEMSRRGLRPALYEELLGFAKKYPDEQREHQIFALGSVLNAGHANTAFLSHAGCGRILVLACRSCGWSKDYFHFLAVRE